jgi:hypothetical protein
MGRRPATGRKWHLVKSTPGAGIGPTRWIEIWLSLPVNALTLLYENLHGFDGHTIAKLEERIARCKSKLAD